MRAQEFIIEAPIPMDPSRRGFLKKAAGTAAAGAAMTAAGPQITALVTNFTKEVGGMNGIQALKAMLKVATADEIYNIYDFYADSGILEDAIAESDLAALARIHYDWSDFEEHCEENNIRDYFKEFQRLTGQPLKVALVNQIIDKIDPGWGVEYFFDQYPEALEMIDPYSEAIPTLEKLENIDVAAKGANLPAPVLTAANAISGLVRQIFKSNGKPLTAPQQVQPAPALPAPTRPKVELPVNVKQKQAEPVKQKDVAESATVERDGITLKYQFGVNKQKLKIVAVSNGRRLGSAVFQNYGPKDQPQFKGDQVDVDERYRGQGIATVMYDLAKELVGRIYPSPSQTADGEAFWKGKPVWEQEQLTEFDPGEGGFGPFKVYYEQDYFIGQFSTYEEAKDEVDFLRDSDPKSATHHWRIVDGTGETVWEYDIGDDIDAWRRGQKFQKRP